MNNSEKDRYKSDIKQIRQELNRGNIQRSLKLLHDTADSLGLSRIRSAADDLEARYFYMLRFMIGNPESAKAQELENILIAADNLRKDLQHEMNVTDNTVYGASIRFARLRPEENLHSLVSDYLAEAERLHTDGATLTSSKARATIERLTSDIFNLLWTIYRPDSDTVMLLDDLIADSTIEAGHRELWVNALGLSLNFEEDRSVIDILLKALKSDNRRIRVAAAVWLTIAAVSFGVEGEIIDKINSTAGLSAIDILKAIVLNLTDSDTDFFSSMAGISSKLHGIDPSNPESFKNIDFSSNDYEQMKRFARAQSGGFDVFGRSLGRMRNFQFFNKISNWFLPFDTRHSALAEITDGEGAEIAESIAMLPDITDSDKYAMLLSMAQMPASMRDKAQTGLVDNIRAMSDTPEYTEAMDRLSNISDSALIANHIHTLVRFVRFFPKSSEFKLSLNWDQTGLLPLSRLTKLFEFEELLELAHASASQKLYSLSSDIFAELLTIDHNQMSDNDLETAADVLVAEDELVPIHFTACEIYQELMEKYPERQDIVLKLARTLSHNEEYEEVVEVLEGMPEQWHTPETLEMLGKAYAQTSNIDKAIDAYHQADYMLPSDNTELKQELAYLYLLNNKPTEASAMLDLVEPELRRSHITGMEAILLWLDGQFDKAVDSVASHLVGSEEDNKKYIEEVQADIDYLKSYPCADNINFSTIPALTDMAIYRAKGSQFGNL